MGTLISLFSGLWDWITWAVTEVFRQVKDWVLNVWTVCILVAGWLYTFLSWVVNSIQDMLNALDAITFPSVQSGMPGSISYGVSVANTILPIAEGLGMLVALVTLMLALSGYKLVKTWIPTLS